jgi:RND family efflux transporter MFP subunit
LTSINSYPILSALSICSLLSYQEERIVKRRVLLYGLPLAVAVIAVSVLSGFSLEEAGPGDSAGAAGVQTELAQLVTEPVVERFPGVVSAEESGPVSFTVGGRVEVLFVGVGDRVEAGDPLARLDQRPFEHGAEQARAALTRLEASLAQARRDLSRVRALGEAATEEELEARQTTVRELEARRRGAVSAVEEAKRTLEESVLTAPYAGEITRRLAERGEVVTGGSPVYLLSGNGKRLEVELQVPETTVRELAADAPVRLTFPLSPELPQIDAEIASVSAHAAMPGGLFRLTLRIPKAEATEGGVRPGLRVTAALPLDTGGELISVRTGAVLSRPDGTPILFAVRDGAAREVPVSMVRVKDGRILARGDLRPNDRIVVSGHRELVDGDQVEEVRL